MTNTQRTTWRGSPSTWRPLLPAEEAPPQGELVVVPTLLWHEIPLTRGPALKSVPKLFTETVMPRSLSMEERARLQRMDRQWAHFTTMAVTLESMEGVRRPFLKKLSRATLATSGSVAAESNINTT